MNREANHTALQLAAIIEDVRAELGGAPSLSRTAKALNERGIPTSHGGAWTVTAVKWILERVDRSL